MNLVDLFALLSLGAGYLRGRRRGLDREIYKLVNMGIVLMAGCGLFKLVGKALSVLPGLNPENSGLVGFLIVIIVTMVIMRKLRSSLKLSLEKRFGGKENRNAAGWVGCARWGLGMAAVLIGIVLSDAEFLTTPVTEGSWLGRILATLLGRS